MEQFENAIQVYTQEINLSKNNIGSYINRAYCFAKLNKYKQAINDYSMAIHQDCTNSHAFHNRGICYERINQYKLVKIYNLGNQRLRVSHQIGSQ